MTLLITGGGGFVMSNLVRRWLDTDHDARVVVMEAGLLDTAAENFFSPVRNRIEMIDADTRDGDRWKPISERTDITHLVHGAAVTPIPWLDSGMRRDPERENPRRVIAVNIMGTVTTLDAARRMPALKRFINVSSGAVYADEGPSPDAPMPEDGYVDPRSLYPVTKQAGELITRRYAELFGLDAVSVRFSGVFGPMDRWTHTRKYDCVPNRIAHLALKGEPIRVVAPEAAEDWISAPDVADALIAMLRAPALNHPVYNVAYGEAVSIADLVSYAAEKAPGATIETVAADEANVEKDPLRTSGRYGAYDISRIKADTGWTPRPIRDAMHDYMDWIRDNEKPG